MVMLYSLGQKDSVSVQYLVARDTVDDYIWPMVQNKLNILSKAGLSKDDFTTSGAKHHRVNKYSIYCPGLVIVFIYFYLSINPLLEIFNHIQYYENYLASSEIFVFQILLCRKKWSEML